MSDMEAALDAARNRREENSRSPILNPTSETSQRYEKPIATAQEDGLPIIDISAFLDPSSSQESRRTTAVAINAACVNYGFFYLTGHGIPVSTLDEIISLARKFFALPLEEKNKIQRFDAGGPEGGDSARGYQGLGENVTGGLQDMQEAIDFYREWDEEKREVGDGGPGSVKTLHGSNLWPAQPPALKSTYLSYISRVKAVGEALVYAMGVALDLGPGEEDIFVRHCTDSFWVLRMINYPPLSSPHVPGTDISQFSCGAHTDYGCVTLLLSDPTPGALQVQLKDGTWLPADPIRGAFVVNIGDMIERWTNGLWKSTMHRVIHRGDQSRVSVPFFYEPNFDAVVKPLEKCVEMSGRKEVSEGSTYGDHLLTKVFNNFYYSKRTDW
jgi:isopenicillin N synthase-like dioxygenase